jgi:hypothetical protein
MNPNPLSTRSVGRSVISPPRHRCHGSRGGWFSADYVRSLRGPRFLRGPAAPSPAHILGIGAGGVGFSRSTASSPTRRAPIPPIERARLRPPGFQLIRRRASLPHEANPPSAHGPPEAIGTKGNAAPAADRSVRIPREQRAGGSRRLPGVCGSCGRHRPPARVFNVHRARLDVVAPRDPVAATQATAR